MGSGRRVRCCLTGHVPWADVMAVRGRHTPKLERGDARCALQERPRVHARDSRLSDFTSNIARQAKKGIHQ